VTFHVVCLAWIFFRAESMDLALEMLSGLFGSWGSAPLVTPLAVVVIAGMLGLQFVPDDFIDRTVGRISFLHPLAQAAGFAAGIVLVDALGPEGVAPFIYFQF
jgi:hypothetical protein